MKPSVIFNGNSIAAFVDGANYTASKSHPLWTSIIDAWKSGDWERFKELFDVKKTLLKYSFGKVKVYNDEIYYGDELVHGTIVKRILSFMNDSIPYQPWVRFLNRVYKNLSPSVRNELFDFLEAGMMPLTDDGCFLAFKKVDDDLRSYNACPDGTHLKHTIGKELSMPRSEVDPNRDNTCSTGLHFCSYKYLSQYNGDEGKVLLLKIAPENVVTIPSDYNNTKGRACAYIPQQIVGNWQNGNVLTDKLYSSKRGKLKAFKPRRDANGRFIPANRPKRDKNGRFASK